MGFTSGGAPFGLTEEEFRECAEQHDARSGWAQAKRAMRAAADRWAPEGAPTIGRVTELAQGRLRRAYTAWIEFAGSARALSGAYVALVPASPADRALDERARREAALLQRLGGLELPIRIPRRAAAVEQDSRVVLVREALSGLPMDTRAGRQNGVRPWLLVAQAAACVHRIDVRPLGELLGGSQSRRAHALEHLRELDGLSGPMADEARAWAMEHLPPDAPATLLHGDLAQSILLGLDKPDALIDWEFARLVDPAYDLAVVTRGGRSPFQLSQGFARLLDAYGDAGGSPVHSSEVRLHELCLCARAFRDAYTEKNQHLATEARDRFRRTLERASV